MRKYSLTAIARHRLDHARATPSGRSAETVVGGHEHALRQTLIALASGAQMSAHHIQGEATAYVIQGRIQLISQDIRFAGATGDLLTISAAQHFRIDAVKESVILLTVVKTLPNAGTRTAD